MPRGLSRSGTETEETDVDGEGHQSSGERTRLLGSGAAGSGQYSAVPNGSGGSRLQRATSSSKASLTYRRRSSRLYSIADTINSITLTWNNVSVFAPAETEADTKMKVRKQILHSVSGFVKPGSLVALLGASGAGKSTLLNVLTYRNRGRLLVDGEVLVNGEEVGDGMTSISAYVQQDDLFIGTLKVKEHLWFQAQLRMDKEIPYDERRQRVEEVLVELGLKKCANTLIGIPGSVKGISGGEMKRLSFASEVLTDPPLMFCDEPTSGLDSFMAESVVQHLRNMAAKGKTILCTIHQPSSQVFALFDRLMLMAEGRVAYLGPSADALPFFKLCGFKCPKNFNPADHYVHTLAIVPGKEAECRRRVADICDNYQQSDNCREVLAEVQKARGRLDEISIADFVLQSRSPYKANWAQQFAAVLWRCWLANARDSSVTKIRFFQVTFIALIIGMVYFGQQMDQNGIQNINGALFLFLTQMTFSNAFGVINAFPHEMPIFRREHGNGMYRVDVYFLCKTLAELPTFIAIPIIFVAIPYFMVGMYASVSAFFTTMAVVVLVTNVATSFGYLISTASPNLTIALALAPPAIIPLMLFGGFFLNNASVPPYFIWLQYVSWFKYANEILVINQWENIPAILCSAGPNSTQITSVRCLSTGQEVIEYYSFNPNNITLNFLILLLMMIVLRFLAYFALLIRARKK